MNIIYFDLDGVIFDFEGHFKTVTGIDISKTNSDKVITDYGLVEKNFFVTMPVIKEGVDLLKKFKKAGYKIKILSSVGRIDSKEVEKQKRKALKKNNIPFDDAIFVTRSKYKAQYADSGILIDDRMKAIKPFRDAGGIAFQFKPGSGNKIYRDIVTMKSKIQTLKEYMLNEVLITFGKRPYPKSGHVVILAGGAASGKGFVLSKLLGIEGKVFDVDALKKAAQSAPDIIKKVKREMGYDIDKMDLKNPENVKKLHMIVADHLNLPNKKDEAFYTSVLTSNPDNKPNIIYDVTLKDMSKFHKIVTQVKALGYEPKNIHIVWVVNDVEVAKEQNLKRDRVVPEDILEFTHFGAAMTMKTILEMANSLRKSMDGEIVFAFNKMGVDSEIVSGDEKENKVIKGRKKSKPMYIKKAEYIYVKRTGKNPLKPKDLGIEILRKIAEYTPKKEQWHDLLVNMEDK